MCKQLLNAFLPHPSFPVAIFYISANGPFSQGGSIKSERLVKIQKHFGVFFKLLLNAYVLLNTPQEKYIKKREEILCT